MRSKERVKQCGEVFTSPELVKEMINKLPNDVWKEDKTFCDNSCGNGNFLVEILKCKLELKHNPLKAISTIYGVDIMEDNIIECKERLLQLIPDEFKENAKAIIDKQIVCHDSLKWDFVEWKSKTKKVKALF